jgi:hypothetical protein
LIVSNHFRHFHRLVWGLWTHSTRSKQTWSDVVRDDARDDAVVDDDAASTTAQAGWDTESTTANAGGTRHQTPDRPIVLPPGAEPINEPTMTFKTDHTALTHLQNKKQINNSRPTVKEWAVAVRRR